MGSSMTNLHSPRIIRLKTGDRHNNGIYGYRSSVVIALKLSR
ncbi:2660_t:CDS:2 [Cetraspora pellucida]|uniref:2660_t:CDS:1 n=1 Tax=Cetraspora pellucida TaxID=1433469 RepID=A0A9N8W181_9GLOM|nr:2660_t:CDS:2 [Cetraspora pellucida]